MLTGIPVRTLQHMASTGRIRAARIGRHHLLPRDVVEQLQSDAIARLATAAVGPTVGITEAARMAGVPVRTLRYQTSRGACPAATRVDGKYRFAVEGLKQWIADGLSGRGTPPRTKGEPDIERPS